MVVCFLVKILHFLLLCVIIIMSKVKQEDKKI